jgi:hypothetical protein
MDEPRTLTKCKDLYRPRLRQNKLTLEDGECLFHWKRAHGCVRSYDVQCYSAVCNIAQYQLIRLHSFDGSAVRSILVTNDVHAIIGSNCHCCVGQFLKGLVYDLFRKWTHCTERCSRFRSVCGRVVDRGRIRVLCWQLTLLERLSIPGKNEFALG